MIVCICGVRFDGMSFRLVRLRLVDVFVVVIILISSGCWSLMLLWILNWIGIDVWIYRVLEVL